MFDFLEGATEQSQCTAALPGGLWMKRAFDIVVAGVLLVPMILIALALCVLNPLLNPGPVFFRQVRMGRDCQSFVAWKFRTMCATKVPKRGAFDGLDTDRVTPLGRVLRAVRADELPQIINVLAGEMSMIGPRPDALSHALQYVVEVPGYADRYRLRPGISGYAQTEVGYVDTREALHRKVAADLHYLAHWSLAFDLWIVWRTLIVVLRREGR